MPHFRGGVWPGFVDMLIARWHALGRRDIVAVLLVAAFLAAAVVAYGRYGFYEAVDYTASRMPRGASRAVVRSYMAHHQGMSLLALAYVLLGRPMQRLPNPAAPAILPGFAACRRPHVLRKLRPDLALQPTGEF